MKVLITDGNERAALAVTRALGRNNVAVIVGAETEKSLAGSSRYCTQRAVYASPYQNPEQFVTGLLETVRKHQVDALFPVSDIAMHVIGPVRGEFEKYTRLPTPSDEVFQHISDKYRLMRRAVDLGVAIPQTVFVSDGCLDSLIDTISEFPVVVKPGYSLVNVGEQWEKTAVCYAKSREELYHLYRERPYLSRPSLIQRRIIGEGQGLFVLMDRGVPLAMFAHRRIRERPPSGGVSVLRESIPLPKVMVESALSLLQDVKWHGVAMVEFKIDRDSEVPLLMEINGRFWGSLQLALDAGVNFPLLLLHLALGKAQTVPENAYRLGVKSRWLLGDLDQLLMRLWISDENLNLPPGSPSKAHAVLEFCRFFERDLHYEVEQRGDLRPAWFEIKRYLKVT